MSGNMRIWDALGKTDPAQTKQFTRAGGFKGTAIKPMWANKQMTEEFGPCGIGWGMTEPVFNVVPALDELMVFCTVGLWYVELPIAAEEGTKFSRRETVYGVGGDKVVVKQSSGLRTDDEAFKKAYTDALSNAMKFIGVAADIHMGMFDDNKYVQSVAEEFKQVAAEVDKQKAEPAAIPPEIDWSYNRASGVLICRILDAKEVAAKTGGKTYVALQINNQLDGQKGKKPMLYYWHATHRQALVAGVGKIAKLIVVDKKGDGMFTVDAVMEIDGVKIVTEDSNLGDKPFEPLETKARLLASTMDFEEEELRELHALCKGDWNSVLDALKARKSEIEAGVEAGGR